MNSACTLDLHGIFSTKEKNAMPSPNITETMSLSQAVTATSPASSSGAKTVSVTALKINQTGSRVSSGIYTVTATAAVIPLGALGGGILGRYAIKNMDGANSLSVLPAVAGAPFDTLGPGEMSMGRFDVAVTAPAVKLIPWGTVGMPTATLAAGGTLTVATPYFYVVTAISGGNETVHSAEATVTPTTGNQTVNLSWSAVAWATAYKVYRSTASGSYLTPSLAGNPTTNSFSDTGAALSVGQPPPAGQVLMEYLICEA
jgi:hypothetical protein